MRAGMRRHGRRQGFLVGGIVTAMVLMMGGCSSDRSDDPNASESTAAAKLPTDKFGDLDVPCGEGDGGPAGDTGVTEDSVAIGFGDDSGYANAPGLNEEMGDAMEEMI